MNEIEKIARRLVRKCVSEVDGNFWFDRTKAAAIIKEVLAAATKRAESAEQENARLREVIRHIWVHTNGRKLGLSKLPADAMAAYQEIVKPLKNVRRFISDEANLHKDRPDA